MQGLQRKVKGQLPPAPASYFDLLRTTDAAPFTAKNDSALVAYATPLQCETGAVFLSQDGSFYCGHGTKFAVSKAAMTQMHQQRPALLDGRIRKQDRVKRRFVAKACGCKMVMPNRLAFPELPLVSKGSIENETERENVRECR